MDVVWIGIFLLMGAVAFDSPSKFFRGMTRYLATDKGLKDQGRDEE
jgi:hypothetical protein